MREIKFRIFNVEEKLFYFWSPEITSEHGFPSGSLTVVPFEDKKVMLQNLTHSNRTWIDPFEIDRYIWNQSTGLHDKNGVEIFEGDVLTNGYKNFVVKFGDGFDEQTDCSFVGFYIHSKELSGYWALTRDVIDEDGSKVIGNIHENPELIK